MDDDHKPVGIIGGVLPNFHALRFYAWHSSDDPRVPVIGTRFAVDALKELKKGRPAGYDYLYEEVDDRGHGYPKEGVRRGLEWIGKRNRDPRPKTIIWEPHYETPGQSYWIAWDKPVRGTLVEATWDGKAVFRVRGDAAAKDLAILLDDGMLDLDGPVHVFVDDKPVFEGVPVRRLSTLLRSARARRDPNLLFTARVALGGGGTR
jgi:hypothetical protein